MALMAMMITDTDSYITSVRPEDRFVFDTNVWISILCPVGKPNDWRTRKYGSFLNSIFKSGCDIYTTSYILSEYVNRVLRLSYSFHPSSSLSGTDNFKKVYRISSEYKKDYADIVVQINKIMGFCQKLDDKFTSLDVASIMKRGEETDFTDSLLLHNVQVLNSDFKVVTDDTDYLKFCGDINIITANRKLVSQALTL